MSFTLNDLLDNVKNSRSFLLRHIEGMTKEQLSWKPYKECKNVIETLQHLIIDDQAALDSISTGQEPDYESYEVKEVTLDELLKLMEDSHKALITYLETNYVETALDTDVNLYGSPMKLGSAIAYLTAEDHYHAGQIAFIRMATDPEWDYYTSIYETE